MQKWRLLALAVCSGALMGVGFIVFPLALLGILGAATFIYMVYWQRRPSNDSGRRSIFLHGYVTGLVLYAFVLAPTFLGVLPLDWFGIPPGFLQWIAALGSMLLMVGVLAFGPALALLLSTLLARDSWKDLFVLPSIWVLMEVLSVLLFAIVTLGPGTLLGAHITVGWLGYLLGEDAALRQLASFGGIYLLSFVVMFGGVLAARAWGARGHTRVRYGIVIALGVLVWGGAHIVANTAASPRGEVAPLTVAAISRYEQPLIVFPEGESEARAARLHALIAPLSDIDILIMPENAAFLRQVFFGSGPQKLEAITLLLEVGRGGEMPLVIDTEDLRIGGDAIHSRVSYFKGIDDVSYGYKQLLMPLGEYVPYIYRALLVVLGGEALLKQVAEVRDYEAGDTGGSGLIQGARVTARFCDEAFSPELFRTQTNSGANILTNLSSLSWFHGSETVYKQLRRIAQVRAVENGRWFVQSGNMAPAFILDSRGKIVAETEIGKPGVVVHDVVPESEMTPFARVGSFVLVIPALTALAALVRRRGESS